MLRCRRCRPYLERAIVSPEAHAGDILEPHREATASDEPSSIRKEEGTRSEFKNSNGRLHAAASISNAPEVPLGADVGSDAEVDVEAGLLDELDEPDEVVAVAEVVLPLHRLVPVPEHVRLDHVQPAVLGLLDQVRPHLRRAARVVDGPGHENPPLPVDHHSLVVVRHRAIGRRGDGGEDSRRHEQGQGGDAAGHGGAA
jgi:hypothetical protein